MSDYVEFSKAMGIPQQRARIYGDGLGNVGVGKIKTLDKMSKHDILISGARITDPNSKKADLFAEMYYEEIRHFTTDTKKIAKNLGKDEADIKKIKAYLFEDNSLYNHKTGKWIRFYPDCAIAQSWQRLILGKDIKPHDRTLIEHELLEMDIKVKNPGISHQTAHDLAAEQYDYGKEAAEYYGNLKRNQENWK